MNRRMMSSILMCQRGEISDLHCRLIMQMRIDGRTLIRGSYRWWLVMLSWSRYFLVMGLRWWNITQGLFFSSRLM